VARSRPCGSRTGTRPRTVRRSSSTPAGRRPSASGLPVTNSIAKCGKTMIACASMLASRSRVLVGRCVYSACGNGAGSAASIVAMCSAVSRRGVGASPSPVTLRSAASSNATCHRPFLVRSRVPRPAPALVNHLTDHARGAIVNRCFVDNPLLASC
jgi:hypothetical protein